MSTLLIYNFSEKKFNVNAIFHKFLIFPLILIVVTHLDLLKKNSWIIYVDMDFGNFK